MAELEPPQAGVGGACLCPPPAPARTQDAPLPGLPLTGGTATLGAAGGGRPVSWLQSGEGAAPCPSPRKQQRSPQAEPHRVCVGVGLESSGSSHMAGLPDPPGTCLEPAPQHPPALPIREPVTPSAGERHHGLQGGGGLRARWERREGSCGGGLPGCIPHGTPCPALSHAPGPGTGPGTRVAREARTNGGRGRAGDNSAKAQGGPGRPRGQQTRARRQLYRCARRTVRGLGTAPPPPMLLCGSTIEGPGPSDPRAGPRPWQASQEPLLPPCAGPGRVPRPRGAGSGRGGGGWGRGSSQWRRRGESPGTLVATLCPAHPTSS